MARGALAYVLDVRAPVAIQPRATLPFSLLTRGRAPLDHGLKVVRVVRWQSLVRFPARALGDQATTVA